MTDFLRRIRDLCLLRLGPQDLPHAPNALGILILILVIVQGAVVLGFSRSADAPSRAMLSVVTGLVLPWLALVLAGKRERIVQAGIAWVASAIVFGLLALPVLQLMGELPQAPDQVSGAQMLAAWLSLALLGWQLAVQGHILRHAMDLPFRLGMLLAVVFFALEFTLAVLLLGRPQ
jgi:hypothetical protein